MSRKCPTFFGGKAVARVVQTTGKGAKIARFPVVISKSVDNSRDILDLSRSVWIGSGSLAPVGG